MRVCPTCGARYEAPAQYCQRDGAQLRIEQEARDPYLGQKILGQFRLEKVIGSGGMGIVYGGWDEGLGRRVAVKILHKDLVTNRDVVARFHREAQIASQLDHANIVRLIVFGQLPDKNLYLVLEYLEGPTLLGALDRDGPFAPDRAVKVAAAVADAIGYAHRRDIVHRDLKPENVILTHRDGDPDHAKVLDFGIAKMLMGGDTLITQAGLIFGTARYISPEGAQGETVDKRSDVYSIGVMMYQLLTGRAPFEHAEPVQMLLKHIHEQPPSIRSLPTGAHVPPAIEAVVMRALAKSPAARYGDGSALARALRDALAESDPQSAIRSMVPTAAMPLYPNEQGPGAAHAPLAVPSPLARAASGSHATMMAGSMPDDAIAAYTAGSAALAIDRAQAPARAAEAAPVPSVAAMPVTPASQVYAQPSVPHVAMPAVQLSALAVAPVPPPATQTAREPAHVSDEASSRLGHAPADPTPYVPPFDPSSTARIHAVDTDEDIDVPGLPSGRRRRTRGARASATGTRTARTVVLSMAVTVLLGAGAAWALGLYPSQQREAEVQGLLERANEAFRAGRYLHEQRDPSGADVEDLTTQVFGLAPGEAHARALRETAARHVMADATQLANQDDVPHALALLQNAMRLTDNDDPINELIHQIQARQTPVAPVAPVAPPVEPVVRPHPVAPVVRPPVAAHPHAPGGDDGPMQPGVPVPAAPSGGPTFTPGRDPNAPPPPVRVQPPPPPPVVTQPPPDPQPPPVNVAPPPPQDPNVGGTSF